MALPHETEHILADSGYANACRFAELLWDFRSANKYLHGNRTFQPPIIDDHIGLVYIIYSDRLVHDGLDVMEWSNGHTVYLTNEWHIAQDGAPQALPSSGFFCALSHRAIDTPWSRDTIPRHILNECMMRCDLSLAVTKSGSQVGFKIGCIGRI